MRTLISITAALIAAAPAAALEPQFPLKRCPGAAAPQPGTRRHLRAHAAGGGDEMLRLANVKKGDVLYDLGSGDGRIPVTAAKKFGVRAVGIDIDPERIQEANEKREKERRDQPGEVPQRGLFQADFREATVVTLYLLLPEPQREADATADGAAQAGVAHRFAPVRHGQVAARQEGRAQRADDLPLDDSRKQAIVGKPLTIEVVSPTSFARGATSGSGAWKKALALLGGEAQVSVRYLALPAEFPRCRKAGCLARVRRRNSPRSSEGGIPPCGISGFS